MVKFSRVRADLVFYGRGYMRNRLGLFSTLIVPVIFILIFGAVFYGQSAAIFSGGSSGSIHVGVQNFDSGSVSGSFINALNGTNHVYLYNVPASENLSSYLSEHSVSDGMVIPATFSSNFNAGTSVNVTLYGNPSASASAIVSGTVQEVINAFNLRRAGGTTVLGMVQTSVKAQWSSYKYIDFLVPGLIGYGVLIGPLFSLVNISSEYKKAKLFKQLSLTPLSKADWLLSKIVWFIFLTLISFVMMVAVGVFVLGANISLSIWLLPFLILGPMVFASIGMLIGSVTKSVETAGVIANIVTFPMMFLSGVFFPVSAMPAIIQSIAHILPLFYVIDGLNAVMIYNNYAQATIDLTIITVLTIGILFAAVRVFKWRED